MQQEGQIEFCAGWKVIATDIAYTYCRMKLQTSLQNTHQDMETLDDGIQVQKVIKYLPELGPTPEPLRISNSSANTYVFKIRTNQRTAISLHNTHGFLKPSTTLQIRIKMLQIPNPAVPLKLQVNYAPATTEDIEDNDSKKAITTKQNLHKKVILLRQERKHHSEDHQHAQGVDGSFDRNGSHEDETPLDSSIKKEDSEHGFHTVEVVPFMPVSHIIRAPTINYAEQQKEEIILDNMFKHTFSVEKPVDDMSPFSRVSEEPGVKMNIFGSLLAEDQNQSPIIEQSYPKKKSPFKQQAPPPQAESTEKDSINPLAFPIDNSPKEKQSPFLQSKHKPSVKDNREEVVKHIEGIVRSPLVESNIIGEEQDYQRQLQALKIRVQCYQEFISDIKRLPTNRPEKKYPKWLFIVLSVLFFFLGGVAKHLFL